MRVELWEKFKKNIFLAYCMAELTGEMGTEAQEALMDLHTGIGAGKKIITATHDFETKLLAIDTVIGHIHFK